MNSYAVVRNNMVQDIVEWDGDLETLSLPYECEAVLNDGSAHIGAPCIAGVFYPPPPPPAPPTSVTPAQGRIALLRAGMLATVKSLVGQAGTDSELGIWWDYATVWERQNGNVLGFAAQLGLTSDQIDQLFIEAATIL